MPEIMERLALKANAHLRLYESLFTILKEEQKVLIAMDLDQLKETVRLKAELVKGIEKSLGPLGAMMQEAASLLGLPASRQPALAELSKAADKPWSLRFGKIGLALARVKREVAGQSEANKQFTQQALETISGSIAILTGANADPKDGYRRTGQAYSASAKAPKRLSREV